MYIYIQNTVKQIKYILPKIIVFFLELTHPPYIPVVSYVHIYVHTNKIKLLTAKCFNKLIVHNFRHYVMVIFTV